tara:strand:- start:304 stop:966 length:663 start_codon:yes stop_codon:yes gene_type:complete
MKQVDFEQLTFLAERLEKKQESKYILRNAEIENFMLFMEMMSKSSSFAHKAHKELRKLKLSEIKEAKSIYDTEYWHWNNGKWIYSHPTNDENIIISQFATQEARDSAGQVIINNEVVITGLELGLCIGVKILNAGIEWLNTRLNNDEVIINSSKPEKLYKYRGYSWVGATYYICGNSYAEQTSSSGILEWCTDEDDAIDLLEEMSKYPQFSNLKIEKVDR